MFHPPFFPSNIIPNQQKSSAMPVVKWVFSLLKKLIIFFFVSTILAVVAYRFVPVPVTPLMVIRSVERMQNKEGVWVHHSWKPLDKMSKHLPVAVMAGEDAKFLKHNGFDTKAIKKAYEQNKKNKKKMGGSSISQQTAKNVFLWPARNMVRKGLEAYFTVLIEFFWSKQRIMEVYLNSIEMGDGVFGAEAVARQHFNKSAEALTRSECALIAASLPNPIKYDSKRPGRYLLKRQKWIEKEMNYIPAFPKEGEDVNPQTASGTLYK